MPPDDHDSGDTPDTAEGTGDGPPSGGAGKTDPSPPDPKPLPPAGQSPPSLPNGYVVADRFELRGKIGTGGFGAVYRAYDRSLGCEVALKLLKGHDDRARDRAQREVKEGQRINHPNVGEVYQYGYDPVTGHFLIMKYIEGSTLLEVIREDVLPLDRRLAIIEDIAQGIAAIHDAGRVHRDIKPENIMVDRAGRAVVIDLGLTRVPSRDGAPTTALGTRGYMAPEQQRDPPVYDQRSDVYSIGVVAIELITGRDPEHDLPIPPQPPSDTTVAPTGPAPGGRSVPPRLNPVTTRATMFKANDRYANAADFLAAFRAARTSNAEEAIEKSGGPEQAKGIRRRWRAPVIGSLVVIVIAAAALLMVPWPPQSSPCAANAGRAQPRSPTNVRESWCCRLSTTPGARTSRPWASIPISGD